MSDRPAKPIALADWEVRAVLDGRKTQKRVPMRRQPIWDEADLCWYYPHKDARPRACWEDDFDPTPLIVSFFPDSYWPGDVLWAPVVWVSSVTLRVTDVRVQRVQHISPEDVVAEGCGTLTEYEEHWSERYTRRGVTWRDNPWVRALTLEVERGWNSPRIN